MAQPTPYQPAHEFWNDEGLLPLLPGSELDIEFGAIDNTLTEILANLALIQRDDGALANASVGLDQLTAGVKSLFGDEAALDELQEDFDAVEANAAAAAASAAAALISENNAETAETNAETAETNAEAAQAAAEAARDAALAAKVAAETAETNAETAETNAEAAETNAEAARDAALAAQAAAEAAFDSLDDKYLGPKAADPTLDNDGNALVEGQLYWNSTANNLRVYDGAAWQPYSATAGILSLVEDLSPQLGGDLDLNGHVITGLVIGTNVQAYDADLTTLATAFSSASASGPASLALHEDTDNGTNKVTLIAPASVTSDKTVTFQDVTGTVYVSGGTDVAVADGGTGASNAAGARTNLAAADSTQTFDWNVFIETPANQDYDIVVNCSHAGTITEITTDCLSGSCTLTGKVNTTALGGSANSVSTSEQSQAHASTNTFAAGDNIRLTVSSNSSCADMSVKIKYTRLLA
jgi:hypothetical protein